jgi:hypothetical protein
MEKLNAPRCGAAGTRRLDHRHPCNESWYLDHIDLDSVRPALAAFATTIRSEAPVDVQTRISRVPEPEYGDEPGLVGYVVRLSLTVWSIPPICIAWRDGRWVLCRVPGSTRRAMGQRLSLRCPRGLRACSGDKVTARRTPDFPDCVCRARKLDSR